MVEILHSHMPDDMEHKRALPGVQPLIGPWLRIDDAYSAQMAHRRAMIANDLDAVYRMDPSAEAACYEALEEALTLLPAMGFVRDGAVMRCPDGEAVTLDGPPLVVLGQLVQADICIMDKRGDEHVLVAALLCFPASWHLEEKFMRPLIRIHAPVDSYDAGIAARVQRLFDGVQAGQPLWRFNRLRYADPELHQPRRENAHRVKPADGVAPYIRSERQSIVRLVESGAVVFAIHTYVVKATEGTS